MKNKSELSLTKRVSASVLGAAVVLCLTAANLTAANQLPVDLGSAGTFAVLAGSTVTNTGPSVINGDLGVWPGTAYVPGTPAAEVNGAIHAGVTAAQHAQASLTIAYNDAAGRTEGVVGVAGDLSGQTLYPGLYKSASTISITGDLTLDANDDPNAVFIFQVGSALTVASGGRVVLTGGARAANVFWQIGSSATMGTYSSFKGTVMAYASVTIATGATLDGRALAQNAAVTLDTNAVTMQTSVTAPPPTAFSLTSANQLPVDLGSAGTFAVLAGSTVTNTGPSTINGDLGVWPGTSFVPGAPAAAVNGTIHAADTAAQQAQASLAIAYNDAAGRTVGVVGVAGDLSGQTLAPGLYKSASTIAITGDLTLDAQGNPNAVFIFQVGSALTVAGGGRVVLIGGARAANVFWQVGSSATMGTYSAFKGTVMAYASITIATGATLDGRALAQNAAVTLDSNAVTKQTSVATP